MRTRRSAWLVCGAAALVFLLVNTQSALGDPIPYVALGASFSAESDTVTLFPLAASLPFDPFSTRQQMRFDFQQGNFHVDFSPSQSPPYAFTLSRTVTIGNVSQAIS